MKKVLIILGIVFGALLLTCVGSTILIAMLLPSSPPRAGEDEFDAANRLIGRLDGDAAFGNTSEAEAMAEEFSESLAVARELFFTEGKEGGISLTDGEFLTYCRVNPDSVVFLVHVPQLRRFEDDAKDSLAELAWLSAQAVVEQRSLDADDELVVGVRGAMVFSHILIGSPTDPPPTKQEGLRDVLYPYFLETAPTTSPAK